MIIAEKQYLRDGTSIMFALKEGSIFKAQTNNKVKLKTNGRKIKVWSRDVYGNTTNNYKIKFLPNYYYQLKIREV